MTRSMETLHADRHASVRAYRGGVMPLGYGDFPGEVAAMIERAGLLDLSAHGTILVRGPDAAAFLNGLTTNNILAIASGTIQPNLLCASKGKIRHQVAVLRTKADEYLVLTDAEEGDAVAAHMDAYRVRESIDMGMVNLTRLDLCGPLAGDALAALGLPPETGRGLFQGSPVLYPPHALGALARRTVLVPAAAAATLAEALLAAAPQVRLAGLEAYEEVRIWAGVARYGVDFDADFLPAEAGLESHLSHNKGCYVGQEIHARLHFRGHPNRKLVALRVPEQVAAGLAPGAQLFQDGEAVGSITSLSRLPREGLRGAIALLRHQVTRERPPLAGAAGSPPVIRMGPLASDLGAPRA